MKEVECNNCKKKFYKRNGQIQKTKNNFCSRKCYSIYCRKDFNNIEILPEYTNLIIDSKTYGKIKVKIDTSDIKEISNYHWSVNKRKDGGFYITSSARTFNKKDKLYLHRFLLSAPKDMLVDHINRDSLDNRRSNLRVCTKQENNSNTKVRKDSSCGHRYVHKDRYGYVVYISSGLNKGHHGFFKNLDDAVKKRDLIMQNTNFYGQLNTYKKG